MDRCSGVSKSSRDGTWEVTTNLDSLDQYDLSLQGTASKMLETSLGCSDFPPRFRSDGGDGTMVALAGSYPSHVGHLNVDYYILV